MYITRTYAQRKEEERATSKFTKETSRICHKNHQSRRTNKEEGFTECPGVATYAKATTTTTNNSTTTEPEDKEDKVISNLTSLGKTDSESTD